MYTALMLGAGHSKVERRIGPPELPEIEKWFTLDMNARANPDYVFDLAQLDN